MDAAEWFDLDAAPTFELCCARLQNRDTRNFAVCFEHHEAHGALNLSLGDVDKFLRASAESKATTKTRWINFWAGDRDAHSITAIARRYGLSSRLAAQLCSARAASASPPRVSEETGTTKGHADKGCLTLPPSTSPDLEHAFALSALQSPRSRASKPPDFGDVVDKLWHFCSVDRGANYICIGFNTLFKLPDNAVRHHRQSNKPAGLRIWTSLLLCNDGTVVSVFEQPPPDMAHEHVVSIRSNVLNVFRQLSKVNSSTPVPTLMQVGVRPFGSVDTAEITDAESGALLFYYLFDDWRATYSLITQQDHPYRETLSRIRREMFDSADTDLIKALDLVGRQLTGLKLIYQSYELIIQRILRHADVSEPALHETSSAPTAARETAGGELAAFTLPLSARVRFERLLDRVRLYALTEIDECLREKDSLVFMNFNLVSLKESQAVETLTRTTILLAKATIVFLPVSLMTGYFSVQLQEIDALYSLTTYWACFGVVVAVSVLGLVVFDIVTARVGGKTTYKSLTKMGVEKWRRARMSGG